MHLTIISLRELIQLCSLLQEASPEGGELASIQDRTDSLLREVMAYEGTLPPDPSEGCQLLLALVEYLALFEFLGWAARSGRIIGDLRVKIGHLIDSLSVRPVRIRLLLPSLSSVRSELHKYFGNVPEALLVARELTYGAFLPENLVEKIAEADPQGFVIMDYGNTPDERLDLLSFDLESLEDYAQVCINNGEKFPMFYGCSCRSCGASVNVMGTSKYWACPCGVLNRTQPAGSFTCPQYGPLGEHIDQFKPFYERDEVSEERGSP